MSTIKETIEIMSQLPPDKTLREELARRKEMTNPETPTTTTKGKRGRKPGYVMSEETKAKIRATREANKRLKTSLEEIFHVSQTQL